MSVVKHITLAPGHGGKDGGATNKNTGLQEKRVTWNLCVELKSILEKGFNCEVFLVQPSMTNPNINFRQDLYGTINEANRLHKQNKIDYYLSIHTNAGGGKGFESYTFPNASAESERVRKIIHTHVANFLHNQYGIIDRGMKKANFAELRETCMPAALFENLFIDDKKEAELLGDAVFIHKLANEYAYALSIALSLPRK